MEFAKNEIKLVKDMCQSCIVENNRLIGQIQQMKEEMEVEKQGRIEGIEENRKIKWEIEELKKDLMKAV